MNKVLFSDRTRNSRQIGSKLKSVLLKSMRVLRLKKCEVSLSLVGDRTIRRLNREYKGIDRPTDVLSFQQSRKAFPHETLGDIIISVTTARKQARKEKHTLSAECSMLAIHGLLHLMGYDHAKAEEAKKMFRLQNKLLRKVGIRA